MIKTYPLKEEVEFNEFEVGDFVTVIDDDDITKDRIFVIKEIAGNIEHEHYKEYSYILATDIYDEKTGEHYLEDIYEYVERQLNKFEGYIESNSPLATLSKVYKNKFEISPETERRLLGSIKVE